MITRVAVSDSARAVELAKQAGKYTERKTDTIAHARIIALRTSGHSIAETAKLAGCSESQVKRVWALAQKQKAELPRSA